MTRSFFTRVTGIFWCNFWILLMSESSETSVTLFESVISNLCTMSKQFKISFTIVFKFQCLPVECLIRIIYIYICIPLGVDDVSWESWWLVTTAIYDEGDGLILLNDTHSCCVSLGFAGTENTKTCKVLLWIVFSNLMDIFWWLKMHSINIIAVVCLKDVIRVWEAPTATLYIGLSMPLA